MSGTACHNEGLAELAALAASGGWMFFPAVIHGVECLYGVREGAVVTETITVRSDGDATVARLRTDDYMTGRRRGAVGVLWEHTGPLADAIRQLRALPEHGHPSAPKLLRPGSSMFALGGNR